MGLIHVSLLRRISYKRGERSSARRVAATWMPFPGFVSVAAPTTSGLWPAAHAGFRLQWRGEAGVSQDSFRSRSARAFPCRGKGGRGIASSLCRFPSIDKLKCAHPPSPLKIGGNSGIWAFFSKTTPRTVDRQLAYFRSVSTVEIG